MDTKIKVRNQRSGIRNQESGIWNLLTEPSDRLGVEHKELIVPDFFGYTELHRVPQRKTNNFASQP
jgi:hypothetical protein